MKKSENGFTLIEMSVVIVIIGAFFAGISILMGVLDNAKATMVVTDYSNYKTSVRTFELKYDALPGDFTNATSYWPNDNTDNGDGDRTIEYDEGVNEDIRAWQHLSLAGIITGTFNGDESSYQIGVNIPESKIAGNGFRFGYDSSGNYVYLSTDNGTSVDKAVFSTEDAVLIDNKLDDGIADTGGVISVDGSDTPGGCIDGTIDIGYDLKVEGKQCLTIYYID